MPKGIRGRPACTIPDCTTPQHGHGYCMKHYFQWRKHGDPLAAMHRYRTPLTGEIATREWRPVIGYEGLYEVSDGGDVRRIAGGTGARPGRILRAKLRSGYRAVDLGGDLHNVHRLVTAAFLGPCPTGYEVNHKDGDKANNRSGNLEYATRSENALHAYRIGLSQVRPQDGERNNAAKLTANDVAEIRRRYKPYSYTAVRLAREFGIAEDYVRQLVSGKAWKGESP